MFSKELFGQRIKSLRLRAGETQSQLGESISITKGRISEIESGKNTTSLDKVALICEYYNVSADYLLGLTDEPKPYKRKKTE